MPPESTGLVSIERAVNKLILNHSAQITERAVDIQRQLTRLAAENRDLNTILQSMARALNRAVVIHDDAGVLIAQGYPALVRRGTQGGRSLMQSMPYSAFQKWLETDPTRASLAVMHSPIGYTTVLRVEKRVAGYLSVVLEGHETLDDFERLVLTYGADVCAVELAKSRAIASAVEQARGDWVQMWLSGTPADEDLMFTRAQQSGFDPRSTFVVVVFRAMTGSGQTLPLESLISLVRDDMLRRQLNGASRAVCRCDCGPVSGGGCDAGGQGPLARGRCAGAVGDAHAQRPGHIGSQPPVAGAGGPARCLP